MAIKNKYKFIRFIAIIAVLLYLIYRFLVGFLVDQETTYIAKFDQMYLENKYDGLIIRNEKMFTSDINGEIQYKVNEGEVVKKGQVIANVTTKQSNQEQVRNHNIENEETVREDLIREIKAEIESIKDEITLAVEKKAIDQINSLEDKLISRLDYLNKLENSSIENFNLEEVSNRNQVDSNNNYFYSNYSGIVSRSFDGLEKTLTLSNLYIVDYSDIMNREINKVVKKSGDLQIGENVYKIIDNYVFYVAYIIPFEDIKLFKNTLKNVIVEIGDKKVNARVYDSFENQSNGILVLEINEMFEDFYEKRKVSNIVTSDKFKGLKIHNDSIVNYEGQAGVFRVSPDYEPEFVPIRILNTFEEYSIISESYFYDYMNEDKKKVNTIAVNDEIYRQGKLYIQEIN